MRAIIFQHSCEDNNQTDIHKTVPVLHQHVRDWYNISDCFTFLIYVA